MTDLIPQLESSLSFARELNALKEQRAALESQLKRCEIQVGTFMAYLLVQYPSAQSLSGHQLSVSERIMGPLESELRIKQTVSPMMRRQAS